MFRRPILFLLMSCFLAILLVENFSFDYLLISIVLLFFILAYKKLDNLALLGFIFFIITVSLMHFHCWPQSLDPQTFHQVNLTINSKKQSDYKTQYKVRVKLANRAFSFQAVYDSHDDYDVGDQLIGEAKFDQIYGKRNFKTFNYGNYLKSQDVFVEITQASLEKKDEEKLGLVIKERVKKNIGTNLEKDLSASASDFAKSVIFAEKYIDQELIEGYNQLGISHLLAVSGLHISILVLFFEWLGQYLGIERKYFSIILFIVLFYYGYLINFPISLKRSLSMYLIRIWAIHKREIQDSINMLALSMLFILLLNPYVVYSSAFWLSYGAMFAISVLAKRLIFIFKASRQISKVIISSVSIQLTLLAIQIYYFNQVNLLSLFINLVIVPFGQIPIMLSFLIGLGLGNVKYLAIILNGAIHSLNLLVQKMSQFDSFVLHYPSYSLVYIFAYYFYLIYFLSLDLFNKKQRDKRKQIAYKFTFFLMASTIFINYLPLAKINIIDVGQGDALLLRSKKQAIMVDVAGDFLRAEKGGQELVDYLLKNGVKQLSAVFLTHDDFDHVGNIDYLNQALEIDQILVGPSFPKRAGFSMVEKNDQFLLGHAKIELLYDGRHAQKDNETSLVLGLDIGQTRLLLMGDLEENEMQVAKEKVDILKVAHHGAKGGSSQRFLDITNPKLALISSGRNNRYGHPSKELLDRLEKYNVHFKNTADHGNISLVFFRRGYLLFTYGEKIELGKLIYDFIQALY